MEIAMLKHISEEWEFNVLGLYNFNIPGKFDGYYNHIVENIHLPGDIVEVGVYRGASTLATALLLKQLGSDKKVYGFDSFSGFPTYHENDDLSKFEELYKNGSISKAWYESVQKNLEYKGLTQTQKLDASNISSSSDFSDAPLETLKKKIDYLGLDNIELVQGSFEETMTKDFIKDQSFMAGLIDCDLFESYEISLPFVWDRLCKGGYVFLDEYYSLKFPGAKIASDNFFLNSNDKPQKHRCEFGGFERWFVKKIHS